MAIELNKCPLCGSPIKMMLKPDKQWHCRGVCGLIVRVQNSDFEEKLVNYFDEKQNIAKALDRLILDLSKSKITGHHAMVYSENVLIELYKLKSILKGEGGE